MARSRTTDFLQVGKFHVVDVSFTVPPVLLPVYGFRGCSLPELVLRFKSIQEANYEFPRKVVTGAEVGNVSLQQGVSLFNSDFWDWARKAVIGRKPKKNILIVQFTGIGFSGGGNALSNVGFGQIVGGFEFARRLPGRAWLLKECEPARYKPGTDFDGMSQEVSIAELELAFEEFEEFSLGV